jgi:hypothetical protein
MKYLYLFFCFLLSLQIFGQVSAPKYSNEFLSIGVGAKGLGMSGTQTAFTDDVTAAYWNPAGLIRSKNKYEGALMHAEYFAGIAKFDYAGFSVMVDSVSRLAASVIRFGVDDIADTRFLYDADGTINYNNITFFSAADYAFLISYSRKIQKIKGLSMGASLKVIHRYVGNYATSWGFGFDAGLQYEHKNWYLGIMCRDITTTFNAWSHNSYLLSEVYQKTGNVLPENSVEITLPKAILGMGRYFKISGKTGLLAGTDFDITFDGQRNTLFRELFKNSGSIAMDAKIGLEANYDKLVFLRLGAGNVQKTRNFDKSYATSIQPNFGVGFKLDRFLDFGLKNLSVDYALTDIGDASEALYSHVFSVKAGF